MNSVPGTHHPERPPLPEGWVYTDEVEWQDPLATGQRRRRLIVAVVVAAIVVCIAGLLVANAQVHYSRGLAALDQGDYVRAQAELSAARLVVLPYRDSAQLADRAGNGIRLEAAKTQAVNESAAGVATALERAQAALERRDAAQFRAAVVSVPASEIQAVLSDDVSAQKAEQTLARGVTAIVENALRTQKWDKAETWTAALLALRPAAPEAVDFSLKVKKGRQLSARLAEARGAARRGEWRKALRLALGVAAVRKGFPGASAVIAEARRELAAKRTKANAAAAVATQPATTGSTTSATTSSSGSSSGSSSAPPPP
jgi:hypothetical protein